MKTFPLRGTKVSEDLCGSAERHLKGPESFYVFHVKSSKLNLLLLRGS